MGETGIGEIGKLESKTFIFFNSTIGSVNTNYLTCSVSDS